MTQSSPPARRRFRLVRIAILLLLLTASALCLYSCGMQRRVREEVASYDRDPLTGVVRGAETITIRPKDPSGPTSRTACLVVHGFLRSRSDFADLGERLADSGLTVRMMRLPGHGTSPADFATQPEGQLFAAVRREYLDLRRDFDRVQVVGFSMGGALGTILASREPVDRLVLLAPYYGVTYKWYYVLPPMTWNRLVAWAVDYTPRPMSFVKVNDRTHIDEIFFYRAIPTHGVRLLEKIGKQARRDETVTRVVCPVLLVHSTGDEASSPKAARKVFEKFPSPDKEARWFTRSNHILLWDYDKEEAKREIVAFLSRRR